MASSTLLATLLIAVATIQITLATYYSTCDPPRHPDYGGYSPYNNKYYVGSKIKFYCKPGYRQYGPSSSTCKEYNKRVYWTHQPPVCKRKCQNNFTPKIIYVRYANIHSNSYPSMQKFGSSSVWRGEGEWIYPWIISLLRVQKRI